MTLNKSLKHYPKLLVISNNPFSRTANNGKTLASFFEDYPENNIAQLYFSEELPDINKYKNYFKISDKDVFNTCFRGEKTCGKKIPFQENRCVPKSYSNRVLEPLKKFHSARLFREVVWARKIWNTSSFNEWLNEFSPEIIFFCAGDSGFAYDIAEYIQKKYKAKLIVYITDDYILPRKTLSIFEYIRRKFILRKMTKAVKKSDLFVTISRKMSNVYKEIFNKESLVAVNMCEPLKNTQSIPSIKNIHQINLIYTGGLHYNRYQTLSLLGKAIREYNESQENDVGVEAYLQIYSNQNPNKKMLKMINIPGASEFKGQLNSEQLKVALNSCDLTVHVESFDKKSINATKLSISTKIPEYLSLGKPILAIGPSNVASIEYLQKTAYCITERSKISEKLEELLKNDALQKELGHKALQLYVNNHDKKKLRNQLLKAIFEVA